jgi:murein DD-endopeptidase MepM/ murein hydrolase activator NlpD
MTKRCGIRVIAILMAFCMTLSVLSIVVGSPPARAVTQSQIDALKKQQKEYDKKKQELQEQINSLEYQQSTTLEKKTVLDSQIQLTQQEIDNINALIAQYDTLIAEKTADVQAKQANEDMMWLRYKANMRAMEENGAITYLSVIFQASSFADLLSRISDVGEIMRYEQRIYEQLEAAKQETISARNALQTAKADQEADRAELTAKEADLQKQIDESLTLLKQIEEDLNTAKELYEQEKKEAAAIQAEINKKVAELKKQQGGSSVKGTGALTWPVPASNIVTSKFGRRYHPVYKEYRMHYGVDIGAPQGVSIVAADRGTVITAKYSSSYGNYIVVSHGNGMTTLYAHMSAMLVKVGATVEKGQAIGKCGSTGASTGPHLHFEVTLNGTRVDPLKYFSNYTFG